MTEFEIHTSDNTSFVADFAINRPRDLNTIPQGETASYTFGNVKSKLTVDSGDTYTVEVDTVEQWDIVVVKGTLDVNGTIRIDQLSIEDGSTLDADVTAVDLGGETIAVDETLYKTEVIVPAGETLTVNGTLETEAITINGTVDGTGEIDIQDFDRTPTDGVVDVNEKYTLELEDVNKFAPFAGKYSIAETLSANQFYRENIDTTEIDTLLVGVEPDTDLQDNDIRGYWGLIDRIQDNRNQPLGTIRVGLDITVLAPYSDFNDHTDVQNSLEL